MTPEEVKEFGDFYIESLLGCWEKHGAPGLHFAKWVLIDNRESGKLESVKAALVTAYGLGILKERHKPGNKVTFSDN